MESSSHVGGKLDYIHDQRTRYDWVLWIFMQRRADHWPAVLLIKLHLGSIGKNQQRSFQKWQNLSPSCEPISIDPSVGRPSNPPSLGPNDVDSLPELPRLQLSQLSFLGGEPLGDRGARTRIWLWGWGIHVEYPADVMQLRPLLVNILCNQGKMESFGDRGSKMSMYEIGNIHDSAHAWFLEFQLC